MLSIKVAHTGDCLTDSTDLIIILNKLSITPHNSAIVAVELLMKGGRDVELTPFGFCRPPISLKSFF